MPSRSNGSSTARYSRMWRAGLSNDKWSMPSITTWWERPIPSVNRPPVAMSVRDRLAGQRHRVTQVGGRHRRADLDAATREPA